MCFFFPTVSITYFFFCLPVINALSRQYFLQANDAMDLKEWVIALNNATKITVCGDFCIILLLCLVFSLSYLTIC